jgi:hypothetical protein
VNTAGTGDAPTLHAAMDSAVAFDIVLVEAGHYVLPSGLHVPQNVQLVGESGPAQTVISRDAPADLTAVSLRSGARMSGVHLQANTLPVLRADGALVEDCIVEATMPMALMELGGPLEVRHSLLLGGGINQPITILVSIIATGLYWGAAGSELLFNDIIGFVDPAIDVPENAHNFSLDPRYCGIPGSGNYFLQSTSPCLPENNPYGFPVHVGPLPQGCGAVSVQERTWGGVKALYRSP